MGIKNGITGYVRITEGKVICDGALFFESLKDAPGDFFNDFYDMLKPDYPKFFKMDNLCKTAFLATEVLLKKTSFAGKYKPEEAGIVFSNTNSSLDTDSRYYQSSLKAASPALFVYTLPNVAVGELCIRHGIKGETACFVFDIFDSSFQTWYVDTLLETTGTKACISGWADFYDGKFEALFYLVEETNDKNCLTHNPENADKIYKQVWKN